MILDIRSSRREFVIRTVSNRSFLFFIFVLHIVSCLFIWQQACGTDHAWHQAEVADPRRPESTEALGTAEPNWVGSAGTADSHAHRTNATALASAILVLALLPWMALAGARTAAARAHRTAADQAGQLQRLEATNAQLDQARSQAVQASRVKSRFLTAMSHEMRTPLNGILGYAQLLRLEGGLDAVQSMRVEGMLVASNHLLQMIRRVLDLSEIEAGHAALQLAAVDPREIAAACLDLVRPTAVAKQLSLELSVAVEVPGQIVTDPTRLRQVLLNLLGNAVKFTQQGKVELRLSSASGGMGLRFEVADTGPGIPNGQRHRLFGEYQRFAATPGTMIEGAGLGLSLSAGLAVLLGGQLHHQDNPAGGSLFRLDLPLTLGMPDSEAAASPAARQIPAQALRVLVVDDVGMNRDVATGLLQSAGHAVTCAESGTQAVALVAGKGFDIVLMDLCMPAVDGLEATRQIRALPGLAGRVPIVAMTAQAFSDQVQDCYAAGMDGHLVKPFTLETLLDALASGIAGHRPQAPAAEPIALPTAPSLLPAAPDLSLPVLDAGTLERTLAFLTPEMGQAHLRTLIQKVEALLHGLRIPGAGAAGNDTLAEAAHSLAGSAGLFGFERLAAMARRFERAVETRAATAGSAADLILALEATRLELTQRMMTAVET